MIKRSALALILFLFLAACAPTTAPTPTTVPVEPPAPTASPIPPMVLTDGLNRPVSLAGPAERIVSLAPANTEILFAIGAGAKMVGRDEVSDFPAEAASLPTVGGYSGFSLETIVSLHPDLVLAGGINTPELVASLEQLGLTVYFLPNPLVLEDLFTNLETVGQLTGNQAEARSLVDSLQSRVAAVDQAILPLSYAPSVYYELDATNPTKPYTAGPGSFIDLLIRRAGGMNIGAGLQGQWAEISLEQLLVTDPGIILLGDAAYGETPEKVAARPGWEALTAIREGRVYPFNDNLLSRPGPRLVDGLEQLARLLHPGVFK